jgi:hypothetical protein
MAVDIFRGPDHMAMRAGSLVNIFVIFYLKFRQNQINSPRAAISAGAIESTNNAWLAFARSAQHPVRVPKCPNYL